ncbi:MAG: WYL domain-containing protein [Oscillospiraceae bacterium]|jgi:predicted DNA-binding transcriptional regulator YafY|nr:WYL domain-containing protein [Oscillospiraceae bacterium]
MPKSSNQKLKILYLLRILLDQTDETHMLSVNELISKLAELDISAERKTIYDDIEVLRQFGLDIVMEKSKSFGYYVASREFELPELKLLADAVQSSKFITERKTLQLIKKLEGLMSKHDAGKLRRQVYVQNRVKSMNESIYYNVDSLHEAISEDKKITFQYSDYDIQKKQVYRRGGMPYTVSPAALTWNEENYYLIAYSDERAGLTHFRVDRMSKVRKQSEPRHASASGFKLAEYSKKVFGMFGGEEAEVKLRVNNKLIGGVIDRFGKDVIMIPDGDSHFTIRVCVALSPIFYGWLFQFGDLCQVLEPQSLKAELKQRAEDFLLQLV